MSYGKGKRQQILYVTEVDEDTGMVAAITDTPCPHCDWEETILHIFPGNRPTMRGCASCEREWNADDPSREPR